MPGFGTELIRNTLSHELQARTAALSEVLEQLADAFREVRRALNRLSDTLLHLDSTGSPEIIAP